MATWQNLTTGNWSNSGNWLFFTLPNSGTDANISSGNAIVDTTGLQALNVFLSGSKTVDVGASGGLTVGNVFDIASGASLVARGGGSVSAGCGYSVSGAPAPINAQPHLLYNTTTGVPTYDANGTARAGRPSSPRSRLRRSSCSGTCSADEAGAGSPAGLALASRIPGAWRGGSASLDCMSA